MTPSETKPPNLDAGCDVAKDCIDEENKRRNVSIKSFNLATFHQLRLERADHQRREEERRWNRDERRSRQSWNADYSSSTNDSRAQMAQTASPPRYSSSSTETGGADKLLARQELLRLGRRYASTPPLRQTRLQGDGSTVMNAMADDRSWISSSIYVTPERSYRESGASTLSLDGRAINQSPHNLFGSSRSISLPAETMFHSGDSETFGERNALGGGIGLYGSQYLLLARTNSPPRDRLNDVDVDDTNMEDADDGSSSVSFSTAAPPLQAVSACDSHGENEDRCEDHRNEIDHFPALCKAQVMISKMEENTSDKLDTISMCSSEAERLRDDLVKSNRRRMVHVVVHLSMASIAGAAVFVIWCYVKRWCTDIDLSARIGSWLSSMQSLAQSLKLALHEVYSEMVMEVKENFSLLGHVVSYAKDCVELVWHTMLTKGQAYLNLLSTGWIELSTKVASALTKGQAQLKSFSTMGVALFTKVTSAVKMTVSLQGVLAAHLISRAKVAAEVPIAVYTRWREDFSILSWIIETIYRMEKIYYDGLALFQGAKLKVLDIQSSSIVAWNLSLSMALSCWQNVKNVHPSHLFSTSQMHSVIEKSLVTDPGKSLVTDPVLENTLSHPMALANETLMEIEDCIHSNQPNELVAPFWRTAPFVRHQLPSTIHAVRRQLHSIPSSNDSVTIQAHVSNGPTLMGLKHMEGSNQLLLVDLRQYRLPFDSLRLEHIEVLSAIRKHVAELVIAQRPKHQYHGEGKSQHQATQQVVAIRRDYYTSSYPVDEASHDKDVFEDVDVMNMAGEFVGQLLRSRKKRRGTRRKRHGVYSELHH